jgi:hypothetical protein
LLKKLAGKNGRLLGKPGISGRIQLEEFATYGRIVRGEKADRYEWLTPGSGGSEAAGERLSVIFCGPT